MVSERFYRRHIIPEVAKLFIFFNILLEQAITYRQIIDGIWSFAVEILSTTFLS
jgi:hypothetical protein